MAKTKEQIRAIILNNYINERNVAGLPYDDPALWSASSNKGIWVTMFTYCWWLVEQVLDIHYDRTNATIREMKPPTLRWMRNKALEFQYGSSLVDDQEYYDNTGLTAEQIAAQKVVANSAAVKEDGIVKIKVVRLVGNDYAKLTDLQKTALQQFLDDVLPPIPFLLITTDPDKITSEYDVYYDPSLLMPDGTSILKGTKPVQEAFKSYLQELDFNGFLIKENMEARVKAAEGVVTIREKYTRCAAFTNPSMATVSVVYKPFAGFIRYYNDADLKINYLPWDN